VTAPQEHRREISRCSTTRTVIVGMSNTGGPAAGVSAATAEPVARGGMRGHRVLVTVERGRAGVGRARR
jgi:hypothetical protein